MSETRKLAAIMAADVAGYSRLTATDEERTIARLRGLRTDLIDPAISVHNGHVVKRTGDGILIEFRSVVDAVRCSIEVQNGMVERNAGLQPERQILFRFGIHLGDVIEEADGDLMGDGVNIAARLESICEPGQIFLSRAAKEQVEGKVAEPIVEIGTRELKNMARPIEVFAIHLGSDSAAALGRSIRRSETRRTRASSRSNRPRRPLIKETLARGPGSSSSATESPQHLSFVVLPFANLSGDPEHEHFVDGVTESLTTDLSRIPGSFVIGRSTAFTYKGKAVDLRQIGRELNIRYVIEGSVQRSGNRLRVNVQLIDAASGKHLWAERFDKPIGDLFEMQDDIVLRLARSLEITLYKAEAEKGGHSKNPDAVDLTMRGIGSFRHSAGQSPDEVHAARTLFERALQIDPNHAQALAASAYTYFLDWLNGWGDAGTDYEAKVLGQANRAIGLAPDDPWGYFPKAQYLSLTGRYGDALAAANAGLAINPNFVSLYIPRANAENSLGRHERAKADMQRAMHLSPHDISSGTFHLILGDAEINLGHFDAAIAEYRKALDLGMDRSFFVCTNLAAAYAHAGKTDEAKAALAQARRLNPAITIKWMKEHTPKLPAVFDGLRKAGLPEQ